MQSLELIRTQLNHEHFVRICLQKIRGDRLSHIAECSCFHSRLIQDMGGKQSDSGFPIGSCNRNGLLLDLS